MVAKIDTGGLGKINAALMRGRVDTECLVDCRTLGPTAFLGAVLIELEVNRDAEAAFRIYQQMADKQKEFSFPLETYLKVLKLFFRRPWSCFMPGNLSRVSKALLLEEVGYLLKALGQVQEAFYPKERAVRMLTKAKMWAEAARASARLSELYLYCDRIDDAIHESDRAVECAEKSGEQSQRIFGRVKQANALKEAGGIPNAQPRYDEAQQIGQLIDFSWYLYAEFLWTADRVEEAKRELLRLLGSDGRQHTKALAWILLGAIEENENLVEEGLRLLRESGVIDELPRGLYLAARFYRSIGNLDTCRGLAINAEAVARRAGMTLWVRKAQAELALLAR